MSKRKQAYIEFPGTGTEIPVPDDPEGEDEAVAAAFDELVASGKWKGRDARGPAIPAEQLYAEFGYVPPTKRRRDGSVPGDTSKQESEQGSEAVRR